MLWLVVSENNGVREQVERIDDLGLNIQYVIQEKASGMGDALLFGAKISSGWFFPVTCSQGRFFAIKRTAGEQKR